MAKENEQKKQLNCAELQKKVCALEHDVKVLYQIVDSQSKALTYVFNVAIPPELKPVPAEPQVYLAAIAKSMGVKIDEAKTILLNIEKVNKGALTSSILRMIALILDSRYADNIKESPEIYCISTTTGKICKQDKSKLHSYSNFAAFRNMSDAQFAMKMLSKVKQLIHAQDEHK